MRGVLATVVLSIAAAVWALQLWRADLAVPLRYVEVDDAKFYLTLVKGVIDHGWYLHNQSLGVPFGQALYDFPQGPDNLNYVLIKGLAVISPNPAVVANLFFLLSFPLAALSAFLVVRRLGVSSGAGVVCSVIFALLPYHFNRGESHLLLSAYYSVPLGAYLFLTLLRGPLPFARRAAGSRAGLLRFASRRSLATAALCGVIGSANLYYAAFAIVMTGAATLVAVVAGRGRRVVGAGAGVTALICVTLAVNLAPTLLYQAGHGGNPRIARSVLESEQLGLKLTNLVLPVRDHRFGPLGHVNQQYSDAASPGYCESCYATLGLVGTLGFIALGLVAVVSLAGGRGRIRGWGLYRVAALGSALAFVLGTIGGVSGLIAFVITPDLRGWNRISLYIAFFSLLAAALALDAGRRRIVRSRGGTRLGVVFLAAVLVVGVWDETTAYFVPHYAAISRQWRSDRSFVEAIEATLPAGAAVFELPYVPFPEGYSSAGSASLASPTIGSSYELLRGYIHSTRLVWSFGAMKGRAADWQAELAAKPLAVAVAAASAAGFQGLYLDPRGYAAGAPTRAVEATLRKLLGVRPLRSGDRDLWFFDMRPYTARQQAANPPAMLRAVRDAALAPSRVTCAGAGVVELMNPSSVARRTTFSGLLADALPAPLTVVVGYPDGRISPAVVGGSSVILHDQLLLPPGRSRLTVSVAGGADASGVSLSGATLTDEAFTPFLAPTGNDGADRLRLAAGMIAPPCHDLFPAAG